MSVRSSLKFINDQTPEWFVEHVETLREAVKLGLELEHENIALREEVNRLRARLGMGRKYLERNEADNQESKS